MGGGDCRGMAAAAGKTGALELAAMRSQLYAEGVGGGGELPGMAARVQRQGGVHEMRVGGSNEH